MNLNININIRGFLLVFLLLVCPSIALAVPHTYYVSLATNSPAGSDDNPGTLAAPFLTWAKAANSVACGDTIYIRGGVYTGGFGFQYGGLVATCTDWSNSILLSAYPGEAVTMTHGGLGFNTDSYPTIRPIYWTFQGITIDDAGSTDPGSGNLGATMVSYLRFVNMEFKNAQRVSVYISGSHYEFIGGSQHDSGQCSQTLPVPPACTLNGHTAYGVGFYATAEYVTVNGMEIYNDAGCGIQFQQASQTVGETPHYGLFINNTVHDNSHGGPNDPGVGYCMGVSMSGSAVGSKAYNNFIYHNYQLGFAVGGASVCTDCEVYNNTIVANYGVGLYLGAVIRAIVKNNLVWANEGFEIEFNGGDPTAGAILVDNMIRVGQDVYDTGSGGTLNETGTIHADPGFPSFPSNIYPTQPLIIAAGVDLSAIFTTDRHGATRAAGAYDIGSDAVSVGTCVPDHLSFTSQPSSTITSSSLGTVQVAVKNSLGITCGGATDIVTLSKNGSAVWGTLHSSSSLAKAASGGVATWTDLYIDGATGAGAIDASASITGTTSNSITISTGCSPDHLSFISQPSNAIAGASLGTVQVAIKDAGEITCPGSTNVITLSKTSGSTYGPLSSASNLAKAAVAGVATWTDLSIGTAGSGRIDADASGFATTVSSLITITASCVPHHLTFTSQPHSTLVNTSVGTISIAIQSVGGVTCTDSVDTITLAKHSGTCIGMTLSGTTSSAAVAGVFTTANVMVNVSGDCSLDASASGLTGATSNTFTIAVTPSIPTVLPPTYPAGTNDWITVVGEGTHWDQSTSVCTGGADVVVTMLTVVGPTLAACFLEISPSATPGNRVITMTTGIEVSSAAANGFMITSANIPVVQTKIGGFTVLASAPPPSVIGNGGSFRVRRGR